uniref:Uncharacterized protein n=1 Tax=Anguilla anguilla TaxID=7936 RepID=A0A0E9SPL4_ANGAN
MRGHCAATLCYVKPSNIDQPRKNNVVYKRALPLAVVSRISWSNSSVFKSLPVSLLPYLVPL